MSSSYPSLKQRSDRRPVERFNIDADESDDEFEIGDHPKMNNIEHENFYFTSKLPSLIRARESVQIKDNEVHEIAQVNENNKDCCDREIYTDKEIRVEKLETETETDNHLVFGPKVENLVEIEVEDEQTEISVLIEPEQVVHYEVRLESSIEPIDSNSSMAITKLMDEDAEVGVFELFEMHEEHDKHEKLENKNTSKILLKRCENNTERSEHDTKQPSTSSKHAVKEVLLEKSFIETTYRKCEIDQQKREIDQTVSKRVEKTEKAGKIGYHTKTTRRKDEYKIANLGYVANEQF